MGDLAIKVDSDGGCHVTINGHELKGCTRAVLDTNDANVHSPEMTLTFCPIVAINDWGIDSTGPDSYQEGLKKKSPRS